MQAASESASIYRAMIARATRWFQVGLGLRIRAYRKRV
jgi:hypothetical protein